jgi:hypothetical protein
LLISRTLRQNQAVSPLDDIGRVEAGDARPDEVPRERVKKRSARPNEIEKTDERREEGAFRFDDPYWDDAFCSYYDPTLRTCCNR